VKLEDFGSADGLRAGSGALAALELPDADLKLWSGLDV
jgi:hypothetical protein